MKTTLPVFLLIGIAFMLALCQKNDSADEPSKLTYIETELGGCNAPLSAQLKSILLKNDTVGISIQNDSISIFVGLNYICCAPFQSEYEIKNDSILISIKDTCPNPYHSCYCRCDCYYTWDFKFIQSGQGNWHYQIKLFSPREAGVKIIQKGIIKPTHSI